MEMHSSWRCTFLLYSKDGSYKLCTNSILGILQRHSTSICWFELGLQRTQNLNESMAKLNCICMLCYCNFKHMETDLLKVTDNCSLTNYGVMLSVNFVNYSQVIWETPCQSFNRVLYENEVVSGHPSQKAMLVILFIISPCIYVWSSLCSIIIWTQRRLRFVLRPVWPFGFVL